MSAGARRSLVSPEDVQVDSLVGLKYVVDVQPGPAAGGGSGGDHSCARFEFGLVHEQVEPAVRDVELDPISCRTSASGPPAAASGATCSMQVP